MSQVHTLQMGRMIAAGSKEDLGKAIDVLASLEALHIVDYDDSEEGFSMGIPAGRSEEVGRDLVKARAARSVVNASPPSKPLTADEIRRKLDGSLQSEIEKALELSSKISDLDAEIGLLEEQEDSLAELEPLGVDLDLLSGYDSITSYVGRVDNLSAAREVSLPGIMIESRKQDGMVAIFLRNDDSEQAESLLDSAGFQQTPIPLGSGSVTELLSEIRGKKEETLVEKSQLESKLDSWSESYGETLVCGLEVLERDHEILTAPVRVAVSEHAFVVDGWLEMRRAEEVESALSDCCLHIEITAFEMEAGGGGHGHSDHHHAQQMPPIAYQERNSSRPMELLTDAVGRPAYGRIDPTVFMLISYPLFFGMMLGDMAYGLATIALGSLLIMRSGTNEMVMLGGKFLTYIGFATLVFGYIYGEFAGFEFLPHIETKYKTAEECSYIWHQGYCYKDAYMLEKGDLPSWVSWMTSLYPNDGRIHYVLEGPFDAALTYPFHRVTPVDEGGNLEHLILLTIYLGVIHIFIGLAIGFRDILLYGNGHGGFGLVCAFFEKGTWMLLLIGGFLFAYGYIGPGSTEMRNVGAGIAGSSVLMLMWTLYRYHGVPFPINVGLAPIEAVGMMPSVISYVRLFAVGAVGVKIAETANVNLFTKIDFADPLVAVLLIVGWILGQTFALVLGLFSPNIHAARLHFVEWMRQYYDSSGEAFDPFGTKSKFVEGDY
jgi:V/A-type H+-transporting ATPase subunit I